MSSPDLFVESMTALAEWHVWGLPGNAITNGLSKAAPQVTSLHYVSSPVG